LDVSERREGVISSYIGHVGPNKELK